MQLEVAGYNQKIPLLVKIIYERLATLQISPERFAVIKEQVKNTSFKTNTYFFFYREFVILKILNLNNLINVFNIYVKIHFMINFGHLKKDLL